MPRKSKDMMKSICQFQMLHENIRWSNAIVDAPVVYSLLERRTLYFLTGEVKHKYTEKNLGVPESWKELYFHLTDKDLGVIGGKNNVLHTYEALSELGKKFIPVSFRNEKGQLITGKVHWVDSFFYNEQTGLYDVRVSPEIMPYLIDISKSFTTFDLGTAMLLRSKYTQKMYELCSQFCGDFRFCSQTEEDAGNIYKKRVLPIQMTDFRRIFNLDEIRDPRTKRIITPASYTSFKDIKTRILDVAQKELFELYGCYHSNLWFDYQEGAKKGRGGKVSSIYVYIYTRDFPKVGKESPWTKGDEPLCPYEIMPETEQEHLTPQQKVKNSPWLSLPKDNQETAVEALLHRYMKDEEVWYYMRQIRQKAQNLYEGYVQVMEVIKEKEGQPKFQRATPTYKHNNIVDYALKVNLKNYFGWSLEPMGKGQKEPVEKDLFE